MLSCRVGMEYIEDVEDSVQHALMSALENWTIAGVPKNPSAWLFSAAHNNLIGELRTRSRRKRILRQNATEDFGTAYAPDVFLPDEMQDALLRMLFVCCDEAIPLEVQLAFALKTLCGFDVREIAIRLFTSETNVYKRIGRARKSLREIRPNVDELTQDRLVSRLPAVHKVLYLMFTEGYLSSDAETALRRELCDESMRLAGILVEHPVGQSPETYALLALMHLHTSRISARQDGAGGLLLLEEQNRNCWNQNGIQEGLVGVHEMERLPRVSRPLQVTFHRAFDVTRDPWNAPDAIIDLGVDRLLTFGQRTTAEDGVSMVRGPFRRQQPGNVNGTNS